MTMRILVNYNKEDANYLPVLQYHLRARHLEAIATYAPYTLSELLTKARVSGCKAILLCNSHTLINCVPGQKPTLDAYRGSLLNFSVPTIVCNSLSHAHTVDHGAWLLGKDLDKFAHIEERKKLEEFSFTALDSTDKFGGAFAVLRKAACIAYDIETRTLREEDEDGTLIDSTTIITCCSWTAISHTGQLDTFVLPLVDFGEDHWLTNDEYGKAIQFMRDVNSLDIPKGMHNGMYDVLHSIVYHAEPQFFCLDTMAMMHAEYSSLPKTLDFVASICCNDYIQWKAEAAEASKDKDILRYWAYNGRDTWYTAKILLHYLRHLPAYAKKNYATQFKFVYPFLYTAFEGIKVNKDVRNKLRAAAKDKLDAALTQLRVLTANPSFNPASPKQVQEFIYDVMGARDPHVGMKKVGGKKIKMVRGTDEKNLRSIGDQHPLLLRITSALLLFRENAKAISTYFDFDQLQGRMLYNINPFGTETGRASCNSSSFWVGTQVQNVPPYAKDMLEADEGFELAEIDNSQSEARCTAYLSQEEHLIEALETPGRDFYRSLGELFFSIPYDQVTDELRNAIIKRIVHASNYMMGAATMIENAGTQNLVNAAPALGYNVILAETPLTRLNREGDITLMKFAMMLLDSYHAPFPRIREWYQEVKNTISSTNKLVSPLGWTRYFFGDINRNHALLRSAVAHGPQNLSVHILNIGLWKVWQLVKKHHGLLRLKAQIHDSVFFQYQKGRDDIRNEVKASLNNPAVIHGRTLRIPTDCKVGISWSKMEKVK
jgi:DNA polymerase I-like protein with 3'-5' exonuclease and polymerase domains